jgi:hypothetical protein
VFGPPLLLLLMGMDCQGRVQATVLLRYSAALKCQQITAPVAELLTAGAIAALPSPPQEVAATRFVLCSYAVQEPTTETAKLRAHTHRRLLLHSKQLCICRS